MRILRTIVAAALLAAPVVAYTIPAAAQGTIEDTTKNDTQILREAHSKLKNKQFNGVQIAVQSGVVTLTGTVPLYADKQNAEKNVGSTIISLRGNGDTWTRANMKRYCTLRCRGAIVGSMEHWR